MRRRVPCTILRAIHNGLVQLRDSGDPVLPAWALVSGLPALGSKQLQEIAGTDIVRLINRLRSCDCQHADDGRLVQSPARTQADRDYRGRLCRNPGGDLRAHGGGCGRCHDRSIGATSPGGGKNRSWSRRCSAHLMITLRRPGRARRCKIMWKAKA
jgi:hypothetical protein